MAVQTSNDQLVADERAFIEKMVAQKEPKAAESVVASASETPPEPVKASAASEVVKEPAVPLDPTSRVGDPPSGSEDKGAKEPVVQPGKEGEEEEPVIEITDEAFAAAMAAERAPVSLDDVPEAARPIVQKKLKDLEGGFTRSMQRLADARKEADAVRAEQRFQEERPDDYIVTMLLAKPDLMEKVNAKLDEIEKVPRSREAHDIIVKQARADAIKALDDDRVAADKKVERANDLLKMGKAAAKAAGVPFEVAGIEATIAAHLQIHGDISEADIRDIATSAAKVWNHHLRQQQRDKAGQYVAAKVQDRKAGLTVRPASGASPAPSAAPPPKNDNEFIARMVAKLK